MITTERRALTVREAAEIMGCGKDLLYKEIEAGNFPAIKLGRIWRIPIIQLNAYLAGKGLPVREVKKASEDRN